MAAAVAAAAALTSVVAPTVAAPPSPRATAPVPPIHWGRCDDDVLEVAHAQCGMLTVPLDHADPDGPTIRLAVARVLHTRSPYRGVVLTNPGGPGGSGTTLARLGAYVPGRVGATYDWYGVDPRGVGESQPALTCDPSYFAWDRPPYVPRTSRLMRAWRARTERYADDCGSAAARRLLPHLRTTDTAADLDLLRQAIGADRITYYGFSYGTYLGQVYATLYPDRVRALVLDGVIDPRRVFYRSNLDQDRAFEYTFGRFLRWVGRHHDVYHLGDGATAVRASYERLHRRLTRHPAGGGRVGPDELDDALLLAAYYNVYYPYVADAWSALARHDRASGIKRLYRSSNPTGPQADNGYAIYLGTECTDAPWPHDWRTWREDSWRVHRRAPFLTWSNAWYNAPCRTWPATSGPRVDVTGAGFHAPVLLLSETRDAATPYAGALAVRRIFPTARLVAGVGGTSHAVSLSGVACTDDTIADLLRDGSLPPRRSGNRADKKCPPVQPPPPSVVGRRLPAPPPPSRRPGPQPQTDGPRE